MAANAAKAMEARIPEMSSEVVDLAVNEVAIESELAFNPDSAHAFSRKFHRSPQEDGKDITRVPSTGRSLRCMAGNQFAVPRADCWISFRLHGMVQPICRPCK